MSENASVTFVSEGADGGALASTVAACLPALPVLGRQLGEVVQQVEAGVVGVCESFQGIAQRARDAVAQMNLESPGEGGGEGAGGLNQLIASTRQVMGSLLQRIEQTSKLSSTTVERMEVLEQRLEGLEEILHDIDAVASNAQLLAFNGQIEAARAGKQGAAFAIVATQTAKMAVQALESSKAIRRMTGDLAKEILAASQELHVQASADSRQAAQSRLEVDATLDDMASMNEQMRQTMVHARDNSQRLASDISQAIVAMQFQDSVSQRVGHVVHTLDEIHGELQRVLDGGPAEDAVRLMAGLDTWADRMAVHYTMASERDTLATHLSAGARVESGLGDNVELF